MPFTTISSSSSPFLRHSILSMLILAICLPWMASSIQCYMGQSKLTDPLTGSATQCPVTTAGSCTKSIDWGNNIITRNCQNGNCTFLNGTANPAGGCLNTSTNSQSYCCCTGDGCNWAMGGHDGFLNSQLLMLVIIIANCAFFAWL